MRASFRLLVALLALAPVQSLRSGAGAMLRGPFMKEEPMDVDPDAMVDDPSKLTDEQLHLSHGTLTPAKLDEMKKEMAKLQGSLAMLMDKQSQLTTVYNMEREREAEDSATKKKVREEVARSLLKHLHAQSKSRNELVQGIIDKSIAKIKDEYQLDNINHPDGAEGAATGAAGSQQLDNASTGGEVDGIEGGDATGGENRMER
eukprot:g5032.t1